MQYVQVCSMYMQVCSMCRSVECAGLKPGDSFGMCGAGFGQPSVYVDTVMVQDNIHRSFFGDPWMYSILSIF